MLKSIKNNHSSFRQQRGVAAVEFAIIAVMLFVLLLGIIEFGRLFYVFNTMQEVSRRAAREAVVSWVDNTNSSPAKIAALFGAENLPGASEITTANINIEYLTADGVTTPSPFPASPTDNITACLSLPAGCIAFVRVSIIDATYTPMIGLLSFLTVTIPASTVTTPAESLGYAG
jgi:Flp pilus assembly protein TadG